MTVIATVGLPGSGKGEAANLAESLDVPVVTMGDVIRKACRDRGLDPAEHHGEVAQALREENGPGAIAEASLPQIREALEDSDLVLVDGVRSGVEVDQFEAAFGDSFTLLSIEAPFDLRKERLSDRGRDNLDGESLEERDERERGFGMDDAMERADVRITNTETLAAFQQRIRGILEATTDEPLGSNAGAGADDGPASESADDATDAESANDASEAAHGGDAPDDTSVDDVAPDSDADVDGAADTAATDDDSSAADSTADGASSEGTSQADAPRSDQSAAATDPGDSVYKVDVEITAPVYPTEVTDRVADAIRTNFPTAEIDHHEGELLATAHSMEHFSELLHEREILDTARDQFYANQRGDTIAFDLKKQPAFVGVVNFAVGKPDELGEIHVRVSVDEPSVDEYVDHVAPRTKDGRPVEQE